MENVNALMDPFYLSIRHNAFNVMLLAIIAMTIKYA